MKKATGKGTITYDNGDLYKGEFQDTEPHGVGKMTYKDGRVCEGTWKSGKIVYEGELVDGKPHGRGKEIHSNGDVYEGEWKNGLRQGKGVFKKANGYVYEGEFKDGRPNGKGTYKWNNGMSYEGEWKDGKRHGKGRLKRSDGSSYEGDYKDDLPDGNGTCNYENGNVYTGEWSANKAHGKGVMTYGNQDIYDGKWKAGWRDGKGTMKFHNGDVYTGEFSEDKMHGKGTYEYAAGDLFKSIGEWKEGKKCGAFDDIIRYNKRVYYENDEVKSDSNVKREAPSDDDTDTDDVVPPRRSKRRNSSDTASSDCPECLKIKFDDVSRFAFAVAAAGQPHPEKHQLANGNREQQPDETILTKLSVPPHHTPKSNAKSQRSHQLPPFPSRHRSTASKSRAVDFYQVISINSCVLLILWPLPPSYLSALTN
eukprot:scaffold7611_cov79-Skeletonema_dohrnii-CCMP3373.AAC.2